MKDSPDDTATDYATQLEQVLALHMAKCIQLWDLHMSMKQVAQILSDNRQGPGTVELSGGEGYEEYLELLSQALNQALKRNFPKRLAGAADSIVIAFFHALIEDVLHSCLSLTYELDHEPWLTEWQTARVEFRLVAGLTPEAALTAVSQERLTSFFRNESLVKKVAKLKHICYDKCGKEVRDRIERSYAVRDQTLRNLDELRQEVIHGVSLFKTHDDLHNHFETALKSGFYFGQLVRSAYQLPSSRQSLGQAVNAIFSTEL